MNRGDVQDSSIFIPPDYLGGTSVAPEYTALRLTLLPIVMMEMGFV